MSEKGKKQGFEATVLESNQYDTAAKDAGMSKGEYLKLAVDVFMDTDKMMLELFKRIGLDYEKEISGAVAKGYTLAELVRAGTTAHSKRLSNSETRLKIRAVVDEIKAEKIHLTKNRVRTWNGSKSGFNAVAINEFFNVYDDEITIYNEEIN